MPETGRRSPSQTRPRSWSVVAASMLSALFLFAVAAVAVPSQTFAASSWKEAACGANLRVSASTNARVVTTISAGTQVTVANVVVGKLWRDTCGGDSVSGRKWLKISQIDGVSVRSLFGVSRVYAAKGLFTRSSTTRYAECAAKLRTAATTGSARLTTRKAGTEVTVVRIVDGKRWSDTCAGKDMSSTKWLKISAINGKSVKSLYGVSYLYAAKGLFSFTPPEPEAIPLPDTDTDLDYVLEGIDISHWQGVIDWPKVADAGKKFAYMKASEDIDFVDDTYETNRADAKSAGMVVGAYHFAQPGLEEGDAVAEADHFIDTAAPVTGELIPVLDLERRNGLTKTQLQNWVRLFMERVRERTGVYGAIYVSPSFWTNYMGDTTWFADNGYEVLWIAHWTTAEQPSVPANAWSNANWTFWQYTSDGSVSGIQGRVDLNRFNGTDLTSVRIP